jgi:hypothetical protein
MRYLLHSAYRTLQYCATFSPLRRHTILVYRRAVHDTAISPVALPFFGHQHHSILSKALCSGVTRVLAPVISPLHPRPFYTWFILLTRVQLYSVKDFVRLGTPSTQGVFVRSCPIHDSAPETLNSRVRNIPSSLLTLAT